MIFKLFSNIIQKQIFQIYTSFHDFDKKRGSIVPTTMCINPFAIVMFFPASFAGVPIYGSPILGNSPKLKVHMLRTLAIEY